jgi:hypothetical protein
VAATGWRVIIHDRTAGKDWVVPPQSWTRRSSISTLQVQHPRMMSTRSSSSSSAVTSADPAVEKPKGRPHHDSGANEPTIASGMDPKSKRGQLKVVMSHYCFAGH